MMVRMFQPMFVRKAFFLAKMYESSSLAHTLPKPFTKNHKIPLLLKPTTTPHPMKPINSSHSPTLPKSQNPRNLTSTYMSERRAKGICYFCDEPFTSKHRLTHKKLQIHVLEIDDIEEQIEMLQIVEEGDL
jgi:hypothetical protein